MIKTIAIILAVIILLIFLAGWIYITHQIAINNEIEIVKATINHLPICRITSFTADPLVVPSGGTTTIEWTTQNCEIITIDGNDLTNLDIPIIMTTSSLAEMSGSTTFGPIYRSTYINLNADAPESCPTWGCDDGAIKHDFKQLKIQVQ